MKGKREIDRDATYDSHRKWMQQALSLAKAAGDSGEVPVAAIVVDANNRLVAEASNYRERHHDPAAHAEILALRQAGQALGHWNLSGCTLYVTLEPCPMCAGAILLSRVSLLVYGAHDLKAGAIRSVLNLPDSAASNHRLPVLGGLLEQTCREQLQQWFEQRRTASS
ncbi:MAG: tRNA adenosine(34) deaminase TadA [Cyanobacteria bacterium J06639_14]